MMERKNTSAAESRIAYLQALTDRAAEMKSRHPSLFPLGLYHKVWSGSTDARKVEDAIEMYASLISRAEAEIRGSIPRLPYVYTSTAYETTIF